MSLTLLQLAQQAKEDPKRTFTSIVHLVDLDLLRQSHRRLRRTASAGVDGVRWADYERNLEKDIQGLLERLKSNTYRAQPAGNLLVRWCEGEKRAEIVRSLLSTRSGKFRGSPYRPRLPV